MNVSGKLDRQATIRLTSISDDSECVKGSVASMLTDITGEYSMYVIDGSYSVEVMYDNEYIYVGIMSVDGSEVTSPL